MIIFALDPGPTKTGFVCFDGDSVIHAMTAENKEVMLFVDRHSRMPHGEDCLLAIEMIEARGMAVGQETFDTARWVGRYQERWEAGIHGESILVFRRQVKMHICGSMRAKDPNIRQALIDRFGKPGTKKNPGKLHGVTSHAWAALAVAVFAWDDLGKVNV